MENTKLPTDAGQALSTEQVASVAGGTDGCPTTTVVGPDGFRMTDTAPNPSAALIAIYDGFVDVTSHIIERVMGN
jgi:hypothetical protein